MLDTPIAIDSVNNLHRLQVDHTNTIAGPVAENCPDLIPSKSLHFRHSTEAFKVALARAAKKRGWLLSRLILVLCIYIQGCRRAGGYRPPGASPFLRSFGILEKMETSTCQVLRNVLLVFEME